MYSEEEIQRMENNLRRRMKTDFKRRRKPRALDGNGKPLEIDPEEWDDWK